jgi:hypothetical protein
VGFDLFDVTQSIIVVVRQRAETPMQATRGFMTTTVYSKTRIHGSHPTRPISRMQVGSDLTDLYSRRIVFTIKD